MDFRQSEPFSKYLEASGWKTERLSDGTYVYIFKLPFLGSFLRIPRPKPDLPLLEVNQIAKKNNAILIKIEPEAKIDDTKFDSEIRKSGYKFDSWSMEPINTLILDLKASENQLFASLKPKWRQYVRLSKRKSVTVKQSSDINIFIKLWQKNAKRKGFSIESENQMKTFYASLKEKNSAQLLTASINNQVIASAFLIFWGQTCHLWHLAYSGDYPNLKPLYSLVWESILFAKNKGSKYFDFEGIEDPRLPYTKKVQPTYFKRGFGGKDVQFLGSYVKYLKPVYKPLFNLISKINPALYIPLYRLILNIKSFL